MRSFGRAVRHLNCTALQCSDISRRASSTSGSCKIWYSASTSQQRHFAQQPLYRDDPMLEDAWNLEDAAFAEPESGMLGRYSDDPRHQKPVSERSNVGMGMVFVRAPTMTLAAINDLMKRLRNLEVNTTKRFVCFTAESLGGIDLQELLIGLAAKEESRGENATELAAIGARFHRTLVEHHSELMYLIAAYRKPFMTLVNGPLVNESVALLRLSNFSGCYKDTSCATDFLFREQMISGGLSYVLGRLDPGVAKYLLLTGGSLEGTNCVFAGLCAHYIAPEALSFLEVGAEKLAFELPESEVPRFLFNDHSLPPPDPLPVRLGDAELSFQEWWSFIRKHYDGGQDATSFDFARIRESLKAEIKNVGSLSRHKAFARDCLLRLDAIDADESRTAKAHVALALQHTARQAMTVWGNGVKDEQRRLRFETELLARLLCVETELMCTWDARQLVGKARSFERAENVLSSYKMWIQNPDYVEGPTSGFKSTPAERVPPLYYRLRRLDERADLPLSSHPRLRYYHDKYDPTTQRDHDVLLMADEVRRWDTEYLVPERRMLVESLIRR